MEPTTKPRPTNLLEGLASRRLLVVTGKGGVGKTTLAAALGHVLAKFGRQVLLLEADPRESVHNLLGVPPSGGEVVRVQAGLRVQNLRPRDVLDRVVSEHLRLEFLSRRVLASPVYEHFAEGAPGLKEMAILGHAFRLADPSQPSDGPDVDLVLLDAPASGHGVSLLAAPLLVSEVIREGPFGRLGGEIARFIGDPERCGIVVATHAEEMPVQEVIELIEALEQRLSRRPELVLVNGLYPEAPRAQDSTQQFADGGLDLWRQRREINDRELARLGRVWRGPRIDLPLLPIDRGPELVTALEQRLEDSLTNPENQVVAR